MRTKLNIYLILTALICSPLIVGCGVVNEVVETSNYSYDVGYDLGLSGGIGRMHVSSGQTARESCAFTLELSLIGTPNDNIDWSSIIESDFIEGCVEGTREAHPGADWIE